MVFKNGGSGAVILNQSGIFILTLSG